MLARPLLRATVAAAIGGMTFRMGWPLAGLGATLFVAAAAVAVRAVWRWDRTRLIVTTEKLFVVTGTFRRRAAGVRLATVGAVEVEQTALGRLLGYGTIVAGELEIGYVPEPARVSGLVVHVDGPGTSN